jgi:hypothetical protein
VPLLLPKFVSEGAAMYHELRKRGTRPDFSQDRAIMAQRFGPPAVLSPAADCRMNNKI